MTQQSKDQKDHSVNITAQDQKMISEFSKRHMKLKEVQSELKAYEDIVEKVKDCTDELEFGFDDEETKVK
jgi:hypothetical protein